MSALAKAMDGQKLSDTQAKGALSQAVDKISSLSNKADKAKEVMKTTAAAAIHTAEVQGTVFLASLAEGYWGEKYTKPMNSPVDPRVIGGVAALGYAFYESMNGKGGEHALAIGNGLVASFTASVAVNAGKKLAEKSGSTGANAANANAAANPPAIPGPNPALEGERRVLLTPAPTVDERRERRGRFVRAERMREAA